MKNCCEECGADGFTGTFDCIVESYEETGRILCDECFEAECEEG